MLTVFRNGVLIILRPFAADGGGPRGVSPIRILIEMFQRVEYNGSHKMGDGSGKLGLPCACFDMIGGSGTGGYVRLF